MQESGQLAADDLTEIAVMDFEGVVFLMTSFF